MERQRARTRMTKDACWNKTSGSRKRTMYLKTSQVLSEKVRACENATTLFFIRFMYNTWNLFLMLGECYSGFEVKVVAPENYIKRDSGLIYRDFEVGEGDCPKDGQQVFFHLL